MEESVRRRGEEIVMEKSVGESRKKKVARPVSRMLEVDVDDDGE